MICIYSVPDTTSQVLTAGALHQADSAALRSAAADWHAELTPLPKPLVVVNIGGPTSKYLPPSCPSCALTIFQRTHLSHVLV